MILWLTAVVVFALDQLSKYFVATTFMPGESRIFIPHVVYWTYVQNTRGAFGLFGDQPWLLIVLALVVLGVFWFAFRDLAARSWFVRLAFGGILGGAAGNIVDRLQHHFVVDFIDFRWWPVFNVADSCITVGVCLLVFSTFAKDSARAKTAA